VCWLSLLNCWYSEADLFRKYLKTLLTGKTSEVDEGVRGWQQCLFTRTTDSLTDQDQSINRTSRTAADQWCRLSVTVPRVSDRGRRWPTSSMTTCRWPAVSMTSRVDDQWRRWPMASTTCCCRWPVLSTTTCCCHGPVLASMATRCCTTLLLMTSGGGDRRWWRMMMDGDDHRRLLSLKPIAEIN